MKLKDLVPAALIPAGEDDAIELLTADHDKVQELFEDFEEIKESRANKEKDRIVAEACRELTIHTTLEEEIFYPAVRAAVGEADMMNEAQVEHDGAKELISQLEASDASDDMFSAKFTVLIENVRHHIKEEQDEMFPKARKSDLDLTALGRRMMERKQELMAGAKPARTRARRKPAAKRSESRSAR